MPLSLTSAVISFSTTGDNIVIPAPASGSINVYGLWFTVGGTTNICFKANVALPATMTADFDFTGPGSSTKLQINGTPYFICFPGVDFIMNQSGRANVRGAVYYTAGG